LPIPQFALAVTFPGTVCSGSDSPRRKGLAKALWLFKKERCRDSPHRKGVAQQGKRAKTSPQRQSLAIEIGISERSANYCGQGTGLR